MTNKSEKTVKNIDYKAIKLYHSSFMLNRILIEPQAFVIKQENLRGKVLLNDLDKRVWSHDFTELSSELAYTLQGGVDRWQRPFLTFTLSGSLPLQCQRCMQPVHFALDENVRIVLFENEESLDEAVLADEELEGMLLEAELDVFSLIEDQILMALPFSPKHDDCGNADLDAVNQNKTNPFAVLAGLKKSD
ncbi:hypothetical protein KKB_07469 [Kingella kingae PYKK081]|nr:hypothetical protein KKB_07469 [Kingella kingae PYKK081]